MLRYMAPVQHCTISIQKEKCRAGSDVCLKKIHEICANSRKSYSEILLELNFQVFTKFLDHEYLEPYSITQITDYMLF